MSDKIDPIYPKSSLNVKLKVDGIFAFPEEWRVTDQANPGMFTYVVKFCNMEITNGKIYPRQLTEKQLREQEQAKKKGGKKQAKKQQNPAQLQKLKQLQQKQQAQQRKRQQLWSKMSEEERFYYTSQNKNKSALLRFQNGTVEKIFQDNIFVVFEEHVLKDGGQWVYIFKQPTANQQQLDKLKKSKPKNLNINDLNPVCIRAWVNLSQLRSPQVKQCSLRCKLQQVDAIEQTPKPNLQKSYIKLSLSLSQPLLIKKDQYSTSTIIKDPPKPKQIPADIKCVQQMNQQLRIAIQSLAMQYSNMFWKDLNLSQQQKSTSIFVNNKKNEHIKRKQQFLYDFNVSGKYKVLKQRLKKSIVHLCQNKFIDKMQGVKSFTGITCSVRDQFYSQIYNFLVNSYSQTMHSLINQKKQKLHQVQVLNKQTQQQQTQQHLQSYKKQQKKQRFIRIIKQYNIIGNYHYGQSMYKNAINKQPTDINLKYQYSVFCLQNNINPLNQVLSWGYIQQYLQHNKSDTKLKIEYILLLLGTEDNKYSKKCWIILRQLIEQQSTNIEYLLYGAILMEILGKNQVANKFIYQAYRQKLRKQGKIKEIGEHSTQPLSTQIPNISSIATYKTQLSTEEKNALWVEVIEKFSQLNLFNIIQKIKGKIVGDNIAALKKQQIKLLYAQNHYKQCKQKAIQLYNQSKDYQILKYIINCCHKLKQSSEKFNYLKQGLIDSAADKKGEFLLNLGYFFMVQGKYGNAIACMTKYLDSNQNAGGLSWQILGISEFKCNNYESAVQCFRHSNLCDPQNKQVWIWLAQTYSKLNNFVMVNQCLNIYMQSVPESENKKKYLKQAKIILQQSNTTNFYDSSIKEKLVQKLSVY